MSSIGPIPSGVPYLTPKPVAPQPKPPQQQPVAPTATDADGDNDGSTRVNDKG